MKFALDAREHVPSGSRSILEFLIIKFITKYCKREGIETTPGNIEKIYNTIADISDMHDTRLTIGTKSIDDVEHDHNIIIEVLKALCLAQIVNLIEINITFLQFFFFVV